MEAELAMGDIILNQPNMIRFYEEFDVIEFKYSRLLKRLKADSDKLDKYLELQRYEEEKQFAELTKKEVWDLQENLDLAYGDSRISNEYLKMYDMVCEKIVRCYINIDGMERLFSEKYAEFEWEMHLGVDYKKHAMNFYRDHFIHQVKDAYSMAMLLKEGSFYDKIERILRDEGSSKIARFVNKMIRQQLRLYRAIPVTAEDFAMDGMNDREQGIRDALDEHYMYNIIYMSSYIAGLFHDIGYPAVMAMEDNRRMIDYLIEMHHFEQSNYDFKQIISLLQNSLLFRVVSPREIRDRIEGDKVDHGTMSALLLLLHFYENGAIHRLEPYKLCAIELAALAIYNHTNKYTYTGDKDAKYERPVFSLNPISYLLRICDDIQEWGRIYFEVADKSNLIICSNCHMPVMRREKVGSNDDVTYRCCCNQNNGSLFDPMFHYRQFPYRRIYNVTVCNTVKIHSDPKHQNYRIYFEYDLDRLLHMAYINPEYAKYRIKELSKMKRLFPRQREIGQVFVDYFVTANIILIKAVIVGKYLEKLENESRQGSVICWSIVNQALEDIRNKEIEESDIERLTQAVCQQKDEIVKKYGRMLYEVEEPRGLSDDELKKYCSSLEKYLAKTFTTYLYVYLLIYIGATINTEKYICRDNLDSNLEKLLVALTVLKNVDKSMSTESGNGELCHFYSKDAEILLKDCCKQAGSMFFHLDKYVYYPNAYFSVFSSEENSYNAVKRLSNAEYYTPVNELNENELCLDAYTDLYYIKHLLEML